ncbi:LexA family protein [Algicola sagamiensis]|uniref:LexA family protein n=1 Tax=Algicola sagamiensis TaxID=163869 RepID=UPI00037864B7|nr:S24 family peptidase [Algicola sagamiensis]
MKTLGQRIRERRKDKKLTQKQVGTYIGVSSVSVTQWEKDETSPRGENLYALCRVLDCNPEWLLHGKGSPSDKPASNVAPGPELQGQYPLISWAQAENWESIDPSEKLSAKHFPCPVECSDKTFVLKVSGVTMEPKFWEGDLIFVDPLAESKHGSFVIAKVSEQGDVTFKQLIQEGGSKVLKPVNPNWPEQFVSLGDDSKIIGSVVFSGRQL